MDESGALNIWRGPTIECLGLAIDQTSDDVARLTNIYMGRMFDVDDSGEADLLNFCVWRLSDLCKARAFEAHQAFGRTDDDQPSL